MSRLQKSFISPTQIPPPFIPYRHTLDQRQKEARQREKEASKERAKAAERERQRRVLLGRQARAKRQLQVRRQKAAERERQRQARQANARHPFVGAPIAVRRVNSWGISDGRLNELTPAILKQLKAVRDTFVRNFPNRSIKKIEYIMNDTLYDQFDSTRRQFQRMGRGREIILFHGTKWSNIDSYDYFHDRSEFRIITNGFKIGGLDGHVAVNGMGMVFSVFFFILYLGNGNLWCT